MGKLESLQKLLSNDLRIFKHPFSPGMEQLTTGGKRFEAREKEAFSKERLWRVSSLERFESWFISGIVGGRAPSRYAESPQF